MLCSPALGESYTYLTVFGGGGGVENRKSPNDTAALGFDENLEAARYFFVVVVIGDVMITGRRYRTFVLAWVWWRDAAISRYNEKTYYLGTFFANLLEWAYSTGKTERRGSRCLFAL